MNDQKGSEELKATVTRLGKTGMQVSRLCIGCMSFGSPIWQQWIIDEEASLPIIKRALDLGELAVPFFRC